MAQLLLRAAGGREALVAWLAQELDRQGCATDTAGAHSRYVIQLIEDGNDDSGILDESVNVRRAKRRRRRRAAAAGSSSCEKSTDVDQNRVQLPTDALCRGPEKIKAAQAAQWIQSVSSDPYEVDVLIDEVRYRLEQLRRRSMGVPSSVNVPVGEEDYPEIEPSRGEDSAISSSPEADDYFCEFPALGMLPAPQCTGSGGAWCAGPPPALRTDEDEVDEGVVEEADDLDEDDVGSVCSEGSDLLQLVTKILHHFNAEIEAAHEDAEAACSLDLETEDFSWLWEESQVLSQLSLDEELQEFRDDLCEDESQLWSDPWTDSIGGIWPPPPSSWCCSVDLDSSGRGSQPSPLCLSEQEQDKDIEDIKSPKKEMKGTTDIDWKIHPEVVVDGPIVDWSVNSGSISAVESSVDWRAPPIHPEELNMGWRTPRGSCEESAVDWTILDELNNDWKISPESEGEEYSTETNVDWGIHSQSLPVAEELTIDWKTPPGSCEETSVDWTILEELNNDWKISQSSEGGEYHTGTSVDWTISEELKNDWKISPASEGKKYSTETSADWAIPEDLNISWKIPPGLDDEEYTEIVEESKIDWSLYPELVEGVKIDEAVESRDCASVVQPEQPRFRMGPPEKSRRACSFFLRGHCKKEDCEFAHDLNLVTCKFWELSECFKGDTCPFLHGYPPGE